MNIATMKKRGYKLLRRKPYAAQYHFTNRQIALNAGTLAQNGDLYYEFVDKGGNIALIPERNLEVEEL